MAKSSIDDNGYRRQTANPVSLVGVFPYTGEQIDYDGALGLEKKKIYWVFRPPEELFSPAALESFNGIPIRIGHIMLGDGFTSVDKEPADGCIYNARQSLDMPEYLIAEFCIYTDKMKELLEKGKIKELSLGYRCQYVPCVGVYNGQPFQFKQVNLRGNHLAVVEHGRCGSSVRVCDEALITFDSLPKEILNMDIEKKGMEKAAKLAEAVKNGDVQACQDCLDFYDLSPEQRKEALAYVKGKKSDVPANDEKCSKAKDEVPPPPPPEEKPDEKKEDAPKADAPAPEAKPEAPALAPEAKPDAVGAPEAGAKPEEPAPAPVTDKGCKGKKCAKDEAGTVTDPSITVPVAGNLDGTAAPDEKDAGEKKTEDAACKKDANGDGNCDVCGKPTEADKGCGKDDPKCEKKADAPAKEACVAKDSYELFAAEYARAQELANAVRKHVKTAFDSALMREVDVARFAAQQIPCLAFAADKADDIVLTAVRGYMGAHAEADVKPEQKTFVVADEAPKAEVAHSIRDTRKALAEFLNS